MLLIQLYQSLNKFYHIHFVVHSFAKILFNNSKQMSNQPTPGVFIELAYNSNAFFSDSQKGDVCIRTANSNQRFLFGVRKDAPATFGLDTSNIIFRGNIAVGGTSNSPQALDVRNGNAYFDSNVYIMNQVSIGSTTPTESFDVFNGNAKMRSNLYVMNKASIGITNSNPSETLDIGSNLKVRSNAYVMYRVAIGKSNPNEVLDVEGSTKIANNLYTLQNLSVGTSNPRENVDILANAIIRSNAYVMSKMSIGSSNPTEVLDVIGNEKVTGRLFVTSNVGLGTSNPTERLDIYNNTKVRGDLYALNNIVVGQSASNPNETLDVRGNTKVGANLYVLSNVSIGSSNPSEKVDIVGNTKVQGNLYTTTRISVGNSNPTERIDVSGNILASSNVYAMQNIGIGTVFPSERLEVTGNAKVLSNLYVVQKVGIGNSNPQEKLHISGGNTKIEQNLYVMSQIGVGKSNPSESVDIVGNVKLSGNIYSMNNLAVGLSNPSEQIETSSNLKVGSNLYVISRLGVATSNPSETTDIIGNLKVSSNIYTSNAVVIGGKSNPTEKLDLVGNAKMSSNLYVLSNVSIAHSNPTEKLDIYGNLKVSSNIYSSNAIVIGGRSNPTEKLDLVGNAKMSSNLYVLSNVSIAHSNPTEKLDLVGNAKVSSNLYVLNRLSINSSNPSVGLEINTTDAVLLAKGTNAQRPLIPVLGHIRYNTDTSQFEGFGAGSAWGSLGGVKSTNQQTYISAEEYPTSNDDTIRFFNSNIESMCITRQRNLGIGISNPTEKLDVYGNVKISNNEYIMGNLGINTSNITEKLQVYSGKIYSDTQLLSTSNDSATVPAYSFKEDSNTGMFHPSNDAIGFTTAGSEKMRIDTNGNVGIGITNPGYRLDVQSNININTSVGWGTGIHFLGSEERLYKHNDAVSPGLVAHISTASNFSVLSTGANVRMLVQGSTGNVGIGKSNPLYKLDVDGPVNTLGYCNLLIDSYSSTSVHNAPTANALKFAADAAIYTSNILFLSGSNGSASLANLASSASNTAYWSSNNLVKSSGHTMTGTLVTPYIGVNTSTPTERVDVAGNLKVSSNIYVTNRIGVNTTNPSQAIHVVGDMRIEGTLDVNGILSTVNTDVKLTDQFTVSNNGTGPALKVYQMGAQPVADFYDDTTLAMRIADGGNVGIGTLTPGYKLDVSGTINSTGNLTGPTITSLSNLGIFGSNTSISASNTVISLSNYVYTTSSMNVTTANATAVNASNVAYWSSNNLIKKTGDYFTGNVGIGGSSSLPLEITKSLSITSNDTTYISSLNALGGISQFTNVCLRTGDFGTQAMLLYSGGSYTNGRGIIQAKDILNARNSANPLLLNPIGGNVGIGINTPVKTLHVNATGTSSYLRISGDVNQEQGIEYYDSASRWAIYKGANTTSLNFWDGTANRLTLLNGGNIGVGTASPAYLFDVAGTIRTTSMVITPEIRTTANTMNIKSEFDINYTADYDGNNSGASHLFYSHSNERMRITSGGNVGIGISAPAAKLDVNGSFKSTYGLIVGDVNKNIASYDPSYGDYSQFMISTSNNINGQSYTGQMKIGVSQSNNASGYIQCIAPWIGVTPLYLQPFGGSVVQGNGYVGLGTSNPATKLHVNTSNDSTYIRISGDVARQQAIEFFDTAQRWTIYKEASTTKLQFYDGTANRMTLLNGGNVGIGTTTPSYTLDVNGTTRIQGNTAVYGGNAGGGGGILSLRNTATAYDPRWIFRGPDWGNNAGLFIGYNECNDTSFNSGINGGNAALSIRALGSYYTVGIGTSGNSSFGLQVDASYVPYANIANFWFSNINTIIGAGDVATRYNGLVKQGDSLIVGYSNAINTGGLVLGAWSGGLSGVRIDGPTGYVGVGTSNPISKLDVNGDTTIRGKAIIGNSNYSLNPSLHGVLNIYNPSSSDSGGTRVWITASNQSHLAIGKHSTVANGDGYIWLPGAHALSIGTNDVERIRIDSSGNVGIGTSNPGYKFDLSGDARITGGLYFGPPTGDIAPYITARTVPTGQGEAPEKTELILFHANDPTNGSGTDTITLRAPGLRFQTFNDASINNIANSNGALDRMYIDPTGNVGIGTSTPGYKLDVLSNININTSTGWGSGLHFVSSDERIYKANDAACPGLIAHINSSSNFSVLSSGGNVRMLVQGSTGNVGIGTSNPATKLDARGTYLIRNTDMEISSKNIVVPITDPTNVYAQISFSNYASGRIAVTASRTASGQEMSYYSEYIVNYQSNLTPVIQMVNASSATASLYDINVATWYYDATTSILSFVIGRRSSGSINFAFQTFGRFPDYTPYKSSTLPPGTAITTYSFNFTANGNFGIGTLNPLYKLDVSGTVGITNAGGKKLQIVNDTSTNRHIVLWETANNEHQYFGFGMNNGILRYQVDSSGSGHAFYAAASSSTSTELMRIQGNGTVGIGTASPSSSYKLDVNGNLNATTIYQNGVSLSSLISSGSGSYLPLSGGTLTNSLTITETTGSTGGATSGTLTLKHNNSGDSSSIVFTSTANAGSDYAYIKYSDQDVSTYFPSQTGTTECSRLTIGVENDTNASVGETIVIKGGFGIAYDSANHYFAGGNVGIGTSTPTHKLQVEGVTSTQGLQALQFISGRNNTYFTISIYNTNSSTGYTNINKTNDYSSFLTYVQSGTSYVLWNNTIYKVVDTTNENSQIRAFTIRSVIDDSGFTGSGTILFYAFQIGDINTPTQTLSVVSPMRVMGNSIINNTFIGDAGFGPNYASFKHQTVGQQYYALLQENNGVTYLNSGHGQPIKFRESNIDKMTLSNGMLGINNTSPSYRLDVSGDVRFTATNFRLTDGTTTVRAIAIGGVGYLETETNHALNIRTNQTSRMLIQADGKVAINQASASYVLDVAGDIMARGANSWLRTTGNTGWYNDTHGGGFYMEDVSWVRTYNSKSLYTSTGTIRTDGTLQVGDGTTLSVANNGNFAYRTNVLFANTSGRVGIGTASPSAPLQVTPSSSTEPDANGVYVYNSTASTSSHSVVAVRTSGATGGNPYISWDIASAYGWSMGMSNGDSDKLVIKNVWNFTGDNNVMTFLSNCNVGIGTTNPSSKLEVNGIIKATDVIGTYTGTTNFTQLWSDGAIMCKTGNYLRFGTADTVGTSTNWSEKMRIDTNGNIGIGTSSPGSYKLYVSGEIYASSDITAYSDIRAKSNLEKIINPLEKIQQINGYTYDLNTDNQPSHTKITDRYSGLVAQEVEQILPEVIHKNDDGKLSIAYGNMAGLFVECIKELKKENNELKTENQLLKNKIYDIEDKLSRLEAIIKTL